MWGSKSLNMGGENPDSSVLKPQADVDWGGDGVRIAVPVDLRTTTIN